MAYLHVCWAVKLVVFMESIIVYTLASYLSDKLGGLRPDTECMD